MKFAFATPLKNLLFYIPSLKTNILPLKNGGWGSRTWASGFRLYSCFLTLCVASRLKLFFRSKKCVRTTTAQLRLAMVSYLVPRLPPRSQIQAAPSRVDIQPVASARRDVECQRPQDTLDGQLVPVSGHDTPRISPQAWLLISGVVSFSEALDIGKQLLFPFLVGFFFHLLYCLFDPALQRMPPHWAQIVGNGGALAVVAAAFAKSFYKPLPVHIMVALGNLIHHVPLLGDKEHENLRQVLGTGLGFMGCKALLQVRAPRHKRQVRFCMWATLAVIAWFDLSPGTAWWLTNEDWSRFHLGQNTSIRLVPAHPDRPWMHVLPSNFPEPFTYLIVGRCKCENSDCMKGRSHTCEDYFERMVMYVWEVEMPTSKKNQGIFC